MFIILVIIIIAIIVIVNRMTYLKNNVKKSKSQIDVYLQQRFELIPNLINVVQGYANYEKNVIEEITKLRVEYINKKNYEAASKLNDEYTSMVGIIEQYPELKASEHFLKLQTSLGKVESQLQAARRIYNNDVTKYNTFIMVFPINIFAAIFEFKEEKLFEKLFKN